MFRHKGKRRTYSHNIKLASILSCVAGLVNITGVLGINTLTTNVTGHFAFFSQQLFLKNHSMSFTFLGYILCFLFGAFVSGLITEWASKQKSHIPYVLPVFIEIVVLLAVALSASSLSYPNVIASALLFAMGLQNALVTRISQSVVRTTHLTGLFTDLGTALSQLFFFKQEADKISLRKNIFLKLTIIACFFLGGIIGAFVYRYIGIRTLFLPISMLVIALWYDRLLFRYYHLKRKFIHTEKMHHKN
ncbi:YoaK family protein [Olivibacter sp. XZL3]|uniref:YoaK family protein n=1 Tax=Olivibacter sp. XZL3 TaxID=1735116 RepID=UPI0010669847|nr:YoaK family protein [Olivibacter sp. XZL3]